MEEESLPKKLDKINEALDKLTNEKKTKKFKLPWKAKIPNSKAKKNWTTIMTVDDNRNVKFIKAQIDEGTTNIDGTPRLATTDFMMNYNGKPFMFQPLWSIEPFNPDTNFDYTQKNGLSSVGYKLLLNKLKKEAIAAKKGFGMLGWIIVIGIIAAGAYYLYSGGKIF